MKRFVLRLGLLSAAIVLIVVAMHVAVVWSEQKVVDERYALDGVDVLFVGSSELGCAIEESPRFRNRVLWHSATIAQSFLMRLKELERRGELRKVKVCIVPYGSSVMIDQSRSGYLWAWYQELPISWRYLDMLPFNLGEFAVYMARNLRLPLCIDMNEPVPVRDPLSRRPEKYRNGVLKQVIADARNRIGFFGNLPNCREGLLDCYRQIHEICRRNGVRCILLKAPVLSVSVDNLSPSAQRELEDFTDQLRANALECVDLNLRMGTDCFFDAGHLVSSSARTFTERLYEVLHLAH